MLARLHDAVSVVEEEVSGTDLSQISGPDAVALVGLFSKLERLAMAGRTLAGRRVEQTRAWYGTGQRTIGTWMAARAQSTLGAAIATLEAGRRLEQLPATREAFAAGSLSAQQAQEISTAASLNPAAEESLLDIARKASVNGLRDECRRVIAAASTDQDADERIYRSRYLRSWTDADGAVRLDGRFTQDAGAKIIAVIRVRAKALLEQARAAGSREKKEAYAADALVSLADASTPGPRAVVNVLVDYAAIRRGRLSAGERCEVPGLGSISIVAAQRLAEDGIIKAILSEGADVRAVATIGRMIPGRVRAAVEARDTVCVIPWCDETEGLELHHIKPVTEGGRSSVENLARPCHFHHMLITHRGWRLLGSPGDWQFLPPEMRTAPDERGPPAS
jgi:hypothetical protein